MTRFNVQSTAELPGSPGDDSEPKRDDKSGRGSPVRKIFASLVWLSTTTRSDPTNTVSCGALCIRSHPD